MELLVVEGADAGSQFTLEGDEVLVGRGQPTVGETDAVRLDDRSISRRQAWIIQDQGGSWIEHISTAANPTLVNGAEISRQRLRVGDRIQMGRVSIDVRVREGMNLSGLTEILEGAARESTVSGSTARDLSTQPTVVEGHIMATSEDLIVATSSFHGEATDIRPMEIRLGELVLLRGLDVPREERFPIGLGTTTIGRGDTVDVLIQELGVSRLHAEIVIVGRSIELVHRSGTNQTFVNGLPVLDRVELRHEDEIQLADRVVLAVYLDANMGTRTPSASVISGLSARMEHKVHLDREIEEFSMLGSFLDVDIVASRLMKGADEKAEHIIVSFGRFRAYVGGICEEWDGQVLNSNGDELMCFFESASSALLAASSILERLPEFNREQNLLSKEFRFRLGAHTGVSLVDLSAGIAYSEVLDMAGHIQKQAEPNTLYISQQTMESVPGALPVTPVGELASGGGRLYRLDRFLHPNDVEVPGD
jgi:pSer/pThr/pTyr-binding forkhead associated (FHA) protein